jgi:type II secretory pathway pseudopilin PulG
MCATSLIESTHANRIKGAWTVKTKRGIRPGFTLVELVVVLMVLIALAGILLPQFSGMISRTHTSAASTNMNEINKAVNFYLYKTLKGYPDNLDVPVDSGAPATLVNTLEAGGPTDMTVVSAPDAGQVASLNNMGINTVNYLLNASALSSGGFSATFSGSVPASKTIATGASLVTMSDTRAATEFGSALLGANANPPETYVIFGLNTSCTAIPTAMESAPVHFDQVDPNAVYSRFFLVFAIPTTGSTTAATAWNARYVGSVGAELSGLNGHINDYYGKSSQ